MPDLGIALPDLLRLAQSHLFLSFCAVGLALLLGLQIAIIAARHRRFGAPLLGLVSLAQTIPGLALLALFYPLLLFVGRATQWPIPALGFLPALLALTVYALLPIVRNGVAAIRGIDPALTEAAHGLGMTPHQRLMMVELPLGAPIFLAGVRTAAVWTIGTATLATTIGQPSLGDLIFSGLQTEDWRRVLVGCIAAAVLALLADFILALVETGIARRSRVRMLMGLVLLALAGVMIFLPLSNGARQAGAAQSRVIVVGAKNFAEQYILADLLEKRLQAAGYRTDRRDNLGSAIAYRALAAGDIDVYVDYTGTLWANVLGRTDTPPAKDMLETLTHELAGRDQVRVLGRLGFENAYAFAMKHSRAQALGITDLDALARASPQLALATDLEFLNRPEWEAVESRYRPAFNQARPYSPTFMFRALEDGSADVITAFSSDGRIAAMDLITLPDPRSALPNYDAVLLLSPRASKDAKLVTSLAPLIGRIDIDMMREANWMVDRDEDKQTVTSASQWLAGKLSSKIK